MTETTQPGTKFQYFALVVSIIALVGIPIFPPAAFFLAVAGIVLARISVTGNADVDRVARSAHLLSILAVVGSIVWFALFLATSVDTNSVTEGMKW